MSLKFLGRLFFGLAVLMIGYTVYGFSAIDMQSKHIVKYGDLAVEKGEYEYFQQISKYYYQDALLSEKVTTATGSFNLNMFVMSSGDYNSIVILIDHLTGYSEQDGLLLKVSLENLVETKDELEVVELFMDNTLSKKWYITTLDPNKIYEGQENFQDILDVELYLIGEKPEKGEERIDTLLYDFDQTSGVFASKEYLDLNGVVFNDDDKALSSAELLDLGILESDGHSYAEFQGILWRNMGVYVVLVIIIAYLMFFRGRDRFGNKKISKYGPKPAPGKQTKVVTQEPVKQNFNSKSLGEPEKQDKNDKK
nr:hypothetical protein [Paracholeplasma sp.]